PPPSLTKLTRLSGFYHIKRKNATRNCALCWKERSVTKDNCGKSTKYRVQLRGKLGHLRRISCKNRTGNVQWEYSKWMKLDELCSGLERTECTERCLGTEHNIPGAAAREIVPLTSNLLQERNGLCTVGIQEMNEAG